MAPYILSQFSWPPIFVAMGGAMAQCLCYFLWKEKCYGEPCGSHRCGLLALGIIAIFMLVLLLFFFTFCPPSIMVFCGLSPILCRVQWWINEWTINWIPSMLCSDPWWLLIHFDLQLRSHFSPLSNRSFWASITFLLCLLFFREFRTEWVGGENFEQFTRFSQSAAGS